MKFYETNLKGAYIIEYKKLEDERGFFARTFCKKEFEKYNLETEFVQCNISYNKTKGTLRGMHYQSKPFEEDKIVTCIKGSIRDVIIDLREKSVTYGKWFGIDLNSQDYKSLYVPKGFAHGFLTLEDNTEVFYQMSEFYNSDSSTGLRYNDPYFGIDWKYDIKIVSDKDKSYSYKE